MNEEYLNLKVGDIVWARRYRNGTEKRKIREGHQEGPYVIMRKTSKRVFTLMLTGSSTKIKGMERFKLVSSKFNKESSFVILPKMHSINENRFLYKMGELDSDEFKRVERFQYLFHKKFPNIKMVHTQFESVSKKAVGDILKYGKRYFYVARIQDNKLLCHQVFRSEKSPKAISINGIKYSFNLSGFMTLHHNDGKLVDVATQDVVNMIKNKDRQFENRGIVKEGKLVLYDNGLRYVYALDCKNYYTYVVEKKRFPDSVQILIGGKVRYTVFSKEVISKDSRVDVMRCASLNEQLKIKQAERDFVKKRKRKLKRAKSSLIKQINQNKDNSSLVIENKKSMPIESVMDNLVLVSDLGSASIGFLIA